MYGNNSMTLRDFNKVLFFHWIWWFLCASLHAKKLSKNSSKMKWSCFAINVWAFIILATFCVEKQNYSHDWLSDFHYFHVCFPIETYTNPLAPVMNNSDVRGLKLKDVWKKKRPFFPPVSETRTLTKYWTRYI